MSILENNFYNKTGRRS